MSRVPPSLLLMALCAACAATPQTRRSAAKLAAPWRATQRLVAAELGPERLADAARSITARASDLVDSPFGLARSLERARVGLGGEFLRVGELAPLLARGWDAEVARLSDPVPGWVVDELSPARIAASGNRAVTSAGTLLGLDRRFLSESSDLRHRTDPADRSAELSLGDRLLRRILP